MIRQPPDQQRAVSTGISWGGRADPTSELIAGEHLIIGCRSSEQKPVTLRGKTHAVNDA